MLRDQGKVKERQESIADAIHDPVGSILIAGSTELVMPPREVDHSEITWNEWNSGACVRARYDGVKRLSAMVLVIAVSDLLKSPIKESQLRQGSRAKANLVASTQKLVGWFQSTDSEWLFSFVPICQRLGFDAERLRDKALSLQSATKPLREDFLHRIRRRCFDDTDHWEM